MNRPADPQLSPRAATRRRAWAGSGRTRPVTLVGAGLVASVIAVVTGDTATVASATSWSAPALFLGAGLVVTGATAAAGWLLILRHQRRRRTLAAAAAVITVAVQAALLLVPLQDQTHPDAAADLGFWQLDTGSRLAYRHIRAVGAPATVAGGGAARRSRHLRPGR